jgi:hypothetical protein
LLGFGDFVPLQKNNFLSNNFTYACFVILFILIGLTTLASSMNLLVLRLATINAEEQVQERLEQAEAKRNAVHLEGDVITPNARLFNTTEKPEQLETISVCSCACLDYKIWHSKRKKNKNVKFKHDKEQQQRHQQDTSSLFAENHRLYTNANNNATNNNDNSGGTIDANNIHEKLNKPSTSRNSNMAQHQQEGKANSKFMSFLMSRKSLRVKRLLSRKQKRGDDILLSNPMNNNNDEFEMMTTSYSINKNLNNDEADFIMNQTGSNKMHNSTSTINMYSTLVKRNSI